MPEIVDLFKRHHLSIFCYLKRMTGSQEQAEDLTQERGSIVNPNPAEYLTAAELSRAAR